MEISLKNRLETGTNCVENRVIQFPNTSQVPSTVIALLLHITALSSRIRFMLSSHVITIHSVKCYYFEEESKPDMIKRSIYVLFSLIKNFATVKLAIILFFGLSDEGITGSWQGLNE